MSRILYTILAILFSTSLFAKEVNNFYINGINNTRENAEESRLILEQYFTDKYGHVLKNTAVISAYNESMGTFPDLIESGIQKYNLENLVSGLSGVGIMTASAAEKILIDVSSQYQRELLAKSIHFYLLLNDLDYRNQMYGSILYIDNSADILLTGPGSTYPPQNLTIEQVRQFDELAFLLDIGMSLEDLIELKLIIGISSKFENLADKTKFFYDNMGGYIDQQRETETALKNIIYPTIVNGGAVNIIAHSQGNFFANKVLKDFDIPHETRLLSVGSPSKELPITGDFVNLREDLIVRATQENLGSNYTNIPEDIWENFIYRDEWQYRNRKVINKSRLIVESFNFNNDSKGHNFVKAYLKSGSQTREKILDTFAHHYLEMGGNTVPRINNIQGNTVCENPLINLVGETQALKYDVLFYGDKCLFFRDDYLTVLNLETHLIESTYDGTYYSPELEEYKVFRKYVNNLAIVKDNPGLASEFAVTLNSSGNVGCTVADNCVNGEITTAQQCENMFTALTGVNPSVMNVTKTEISWDYPKRCKFIIGDYSKILFFYINSGTLEFDKFYVFTSENPSTNEKFYIENVEPTTYKVVILDSEDNYINVIGEIYTLEGNFGFVSGDKLYLVGDVIDITVNWLQLEDRNKKFIIYILPFGEI